ncbi:MAG: hypothetical protein ABEJ85_04215 [Haloarculaceae archaeon]
MADLRERIESLLDDGATSAWSGSVADLLYDGEDVEATVDVGDSSVVVTSHRVIALTPDTAGENFRAVDRPNVDGVRAGNEGDSDLLAKGLRAGLYAVLLLGIGLAFDFERFVPSGVSAEGAGRIGVGGLFGTMNRFLGLIGRIDDFMVLFGALALFLTAVLLGVYLLTRDRVLVVGVAGGDDISVPVDDATGAVDRLDAVLFDGGGSEVRPDDAQADGFKSDDPL